MAQRFGVAKDDVILSINGEAVQSKADALNLGRRQYDRGTRPFVVRYLSGGQVVDRTYQTSDR